MSVQSIVKKHQPPLNGRNRPREGKPHIFMQRGFWRVLPTSGRWHKNGNRKVAKRMHAAYSFASRLNKEITI